MHLMHPLKAMYTAAVIGLFAMSATFVAAQPQELTDKDAINGTMDIQFNTRTNPDDSGDLKAGSPKLGVKDNYNFTLNVAKTTQYAGTIHRQPNLYTKVLQRKKQEAQITFDVNLLVLNPANLSQKKQVGKWAGTVPIDTQSGAYLLGGGSKVESPLRIAVDAVGTAQAFTDKFNGKLVGKAEKKEGLAGYTYKRLVGNKEVTVTVKRVDPMRFDNIELAMGPAQTYPHTYVNGRLDYDYETGNWLTDGIVFKYSLDGKDYEDKVTGTIKWIEDPDRKSNGKGHYEFNLRFNEEKNRKAGSEASAFDKMSNEEAFFAVDESIPSLTGTIEYVDTMSGDTVSASKITYKLTGNKLTKQQAMNFAKLWLIAIGPTNDE